MEGNDVINDLQLLGANKEEHNEEDDAETDEEVDRMVDALMRIDVAAAKNGELKDNLNKEPNDINKDKNIFRCEIQGCNFTTKKEGGIPIHMGKVHKT